MALLLFHLVLPVSCLCLAVDSSDSALLFNVPVSFLLCTTSYLQRCLSESILLFHGGIPVWIAQEIDEHGFIVLLILDLCHGFLFHFAFLELIGHILKSRVLLGFSLELH